MPLEDVIMFSSLGAIGIVCGVLAAVLVRRSPYPFLWTAVAAFPGATILGLFGGMGWMVFHYLRTGHSLGQAVGGGVASGMTFAVLATALSGIPALVLGMVLQCLLQRSWRRCRLRRPPQLPNSLPNVTHDPAA